MYSASTPDYSSPRPRLGPGRPPLSASPQPLPQQLQPPPPPVLEGPIALSVMTPSNNPQAFPSLTYRRPVGYGVQGGGAYGSGARGVDHLTRINMALQTQLDSEVEWALSSLLELSFRNPEIIQFKLQLKLLRNVLERVAKADLLFKDGTDAVGALDDEYNSTQKGLEALLIIRNASLDPENGQVLAHNPTCLDVVVRGLSMPSKPFYSEFRSYSFDIAESISFHLTPDSVDDPLFVAVVSTVDNSEDRGLIIPALRCLARLVIRDERNLVESISSKTIAKLLRFLLVDDEELISAVLDFLYQYTANTANVPRLTRNAFNL
jgi:chromatin structure-remodeling complex subunit RSC9